MELQALERREPSVLVPSRIEDEPVRSPTRRYASGPSSGPGREEREVDVEEHRAEHTARIRADAAHLTRDGGYP